MTLPSKILKMKRKLSDQPYYVGLIVLALLGLNIILAFSYRATSLTWNFGEVKLSIPVVLPPESEVVEGGSIDDKTLGIVLGPHSLTFGTLESIGKKYYNVGNKFSVKHQNGRPQLLKVLSIVRRRKMVALNKTQSVVLIPFGDWPVALIIEFAAQLRRSGMFRNIVLSNGLT